MNGDSALAYIENMALELGCAATHVDGALYLEARMPSLSALSDSRTSIDRDHRELSNSGGLKLVKTTKPASRTAVSFWDRPLSPQQNRIFRKPPKAEHAPLMPGAL